MIIKAPAKINLAIDVKEENEFGYHEVDMILVPIILHDVIDIEALPSGDEFFITCNDLKIPTDESNLVFKMMSVAIRRFKLKKKSYIVDIHKNIPVGTGLGGGSADAAAVLRALILINKIKPTYQEIVDVCREVGSDVPFCYFNIPSRVQGTGEVLIPIMIKMQFNVLVVFQKNPLLTKEVFKKHDELPIVHPSIDDCYDALATADIKKLKASMVNSLEAAAISLNPGIQVLKDQLKADGFEFVLMSGSGSAVFALSQDSKKLQAEALKLLKMGYDARITSTLK